MAGIRPQSGHEQADHRPALVLTPSRYNGRTGLMICCPLATQIKGYPLEVQVDIDGATSAVLADQVKSLDWKARRAQKKSTVPTDVLVHVRAVLKALLAIG
jgi:mRNA interferase MazF